MPSSWNIKISPGKTPNTVVFQPNLLGARPGDPLNVDFGDNITWNNTTKQDLVLTVVSINPMPNPNPGNVFQLIKIPREDVSRPIYNVGVGQPPAPQTTITYSCVTPSQNQHKIIVGITGAPKPKTKPKKKKQPGPKQKQARGRKR
jgi:hypothetical protein